MYLQKPFLLPFLLIGILLSSCSSNNDVVSNGPFVKHKHRKGFHLDLRKGVKDRSASDHVASIDTKQPQSLPGLEPTQKVSKRDVQRPSNLVASVMEELNLTKTSNPNSPIYFERIQKDQQEPSEIKKENRKKFTSASKTQRRGRWALFFSILEGVCWLINFSSWILPISQTVLIINLLFFIAFFTTALILGWKIRKRNDAAKWAVILAFGYIALNVAIYIVGSIIGLMILV